LILFVHVEVIESVSLVSWKECNWWLIESRVLRIVFRSYRFEKLIQLGKLLRCCLHLIDELSKACIEAVVEVTEDKSKVCENIRVKKLSLPITALGLFYEVAHHGIS
jgi:hypothetical protein